MDLEIYYPYKDYRPPVFQSPSRRGWMDATHDKHPYQCVPLIRANSHGWEMRLEQDVTVEWDGGEYPENLHILEGHTDPRTGYGVVDNSLGSGVLSFHVYALIKTPEPYNLFVSGPPNLYIKGAIPLTGVVETWWSPYTFTMNWKIRYKNRPVTFKKGTPFVYFFPINSIELEQFTPVYKDIEEHVHAAEYEEWSLDRAHNPQKRHHYYKHGITPSGCPITNPEFHKLKINLKEPKEKPATE